MRPDPVKQPPRQWRRIGLAGLLAAATFAVSFLFSYGPAHDRMTLPGAVAVSVIAAGAVGLSSYRPIAALVLAFCITVAQPLLDVTVEVMDLIVVLLVFQVAMSTTVSVVLLAVVSWVVLTINDLWQRSATRASMMEPSVLYPILLTGLAVGLGLQSRRVRVQNAELIALRDADRLRAVSDERRRIALDLHDVAAHHLSALVVRNKLATRLNTPVALQQAATFTAEVAADTLTSLRNVVRVLNTERESPLSPTPRLSDLGPVMQRMEAAGLHIRGQIDELGPLDQELESALVRITQESLANVLRHRGPGPCSVTLSREHGMVMLVVEDDGRALTAVTETPTSLRAGTRSLPVDGYGVIGMRERTSARGGHFAAGPTAGGGWRVAATFEISEP